jgi:hypothetical protein
MTTEPPPDREKQVGSGSRRGASAVGGRFPWLAPVLVAVSVLVVALTSITPWPVGAFEDDGIYTVLAKSLATGEGYRMINLPGSPNATHYPPLYPLVLAGLWRLWPDFPDNIVVFKFANAFFLAAASLGAFLFARRRLGLPRWGAALVALGGTLSVVVLYVTGLVLSEPLFLALLFAALPVAERSADDGKVRTALLAGCLLGLLTLVRTLGGAAILALFATLLLRRHWRAAVAFAAAAAILVVPWQLWVGAHHEEIAPVLAGKYGAYGPWLVDGYRAGGLAFARDVVAENLEQMDAMMSFVLMPVSSRWPRLFILAAAVAVILGGLVVIGRRAGVTSLFIVGYITIVLLWPFEPDRFMMALWPLLAMLIGVSLAAVWRWGPTGTFPRTLRAAALGGILAVIGGHAAYNWRGYSNRWWEAVQRQAGESAKPLVEWVGRHTRAEDVLSIEHDLIIYLYTGRRAVPTGTFLPRYRVSPPSREEFAMWADTLLTTYRPRYFISGWRLAVDAANAMATRTPPRLRPVDTLATALVYERIEP